MGRLADLFNAPWFGTFIGLLGLALGFVPLREVSASRETELSVR